MLIFPFTFLGEVCVWFVEIISLSLCVLLASFFQSRGSSLLVEILLSLCFIMHAHTNMLSNSEAHTD